VIYILVKEVPIYAYIFSTRRTRGGVSINEEREGGIWGKIRLYRFFEFEN